MGGGGNKFDQMLGNVNVNSLTQPAGGFDLASLMAYMKPSKSEKIGSIFGGLAELAASLNKYRGAELQANIAQTNLQKNKLLQEGKASNIQNLASIVKATQGDPTTNMTDYAYYVKQMEALGKTPVDFGKFISNKYKLLGGSSEGGFNLDALGGGAGEGGTL